MKRPKRIMLYPLDVKRDEDNGLWFRVPSWIVRAYRLKDSGTNMGKVKFTIRDDKRPIAGYSHEERTKDEYFKRNWWGKLRRERRINNKAIEVTK